MRRCRTCEKEIPRARLAALPTAETCVSCSDEQPVRGFMTWEHKTAPTIVIGPAADELRRFSRKGVHAQLPMSSRERAARDSQTTSSVVTPVTAGGNLLRPAAVDEGQVVAVPARCHPERPRATPDGKCVECAVEWYRRGRVWPG